MRHGKKFNHLGRKAAHRKAMLANMACSLIEHKRINTTVAKAKALKQFVEPLITKSKAENNQTTEKGMHNRRIAFKNLRNKYAVTELFGPVSEKVGDRPGGYTRIIKLGNRLGDNADMAMIELVDFNELYNAGKSKKKSTRRSRRGRGGSKSEAAVAAVAENAEESVEAMDVETENVEAVAAEVETVDVETVDAENVEVETADEETVKQETVESETPEEETAKQETAGDETEQSETPEGESSDDDTKTNTSGE